MYWEEFSEKFHVAEGCAVGAIHFHQLLVVLADFDDRACFIPFQGVWTGLILDADVHGHQL